MGSESDSSEKPTAVTIHVTGFKKFQGVTENPTEILVSNLKEYVQRRGIPTGVTLGSCTALETAGEGALPVLYNLLDLGTSEALTGSSSNNQVVWVHFGVDSGAKKFTIEQQAVNEATFCCPDELGWQPESLPVVPEDGGISRTRKTSCCVDAIVKFLNEKGYDVEISNNAGLFVCNYVYYHSLRFAEQKGHKSLFVHVPSFSTIDEDTQMHFAASLLEAIAAVCQS